MSIVDAGRSACTGVHTVAIHGPLQVQRVPDIRGWFHCYQEVLRARWKVLARQRTSKKNKEFILGSVRQRQTRRAF